MQRKYPLTQHNYTNYIALDNVNIKPNNSATNPSVENLQQHYISRYRLGCTIADVGTRVRRVQ